MGYRSEVHIAVDKKTWRNENFVGNIPEDLLKEVCTGIEREYEYIHLSGWKWYEDVYEDVDEIMAWIHSLPNDKVKYVRLGEDPKDIDEHGEMESIYPTTDIGFW